MEPAALSMDSAKSKNGTPERGSSPLSPRGGVVKTILFEVLLELIEVSTKSNEAAERVMQMKSSTYLAKKRISPDSEEDDDGWGLKPLPHQTMSLLPLLPSDEDDVFQASPKSTHTGCMADHT